MTVEEVERLEVFKLLAYKEQRAVREFLTNGRDLLKAVYDVYWVKDEQGARNMARKLRRRPEFQEILYLVDGKEVPTAQEIARSLFRIGQSPELPATARVEALNGAANLLGYGNTPKKDEKSRAEAAVEKLAEE